MKRLALVALVCVVIVAGCGSGDGDLSGAAVSKKAPTKNMGTSASTTLPPTTSTTRALAEQGYDVRRVPTAPGLDVAQGYRFNASKTTPYGYVMSFQTADGIENSSYKLYNAVTKQGSIAAAVIEHYSWAGGRRDPLSLTVRMTEASAQRLKSIAPSKFTRIEFAIFEPDGVGGYRYALGTASESAQYLKTAYPYIEGPPVSGLTVATQPAATPSDVPQNVVVTFTLTPGSVGQLLRRGPAGSTYTMPWGGA